MRDPVFWQQDQPAWIRYPCGCGYTFSTIYAGPAADVRPCGLCGTAVAGDLFRLGPPAAMTERDALEAEMRGVLDALEDLAEARGMSLLAVLGKPTADGTLWCGASEPEDMTVSDQLLATYHQMRKDSGR